MRHRAEPVPPGRPEQPRVVLVTRADCHLCADARQVVGQVAAELSVPWAERDVDADPDLQSKWSEWVPVVLVDGEVHDWFRVQHDRLTEALLRTGG